MASPAQLRNPDGHGPYQERLYAYCRNNGIRDPTWQIVSDRRGGRTAWSCTVTIQGQQIPARFWYDGQFVMNAREDAAERALQVHGQLPAPVGPQPAHLQQMTQQQREEQERERARVFQQQAISPEAYAGKRPDVRYFEGF